MKLCDKIRYLREVEGQLRGLGRAMTQGELVRAVRDELGETNGTLSQSYLSQIESGTRPHLTNTTRLLLARFFKVHPGYLVDDPDGYQDELVSELRHQATLDEKLDLWLIGGAERFRRDPELRRALLAIARHQDSRRCLLLLESILETPSLSERLLELLRPEAGSTLVPQSLVDAVQARGVPVLQVYGATETSPIAVYTRLGGDLTRPLSTGLPGLLCEARIVDDDGQEVHSGIAGEVEVRGPNVLTEYWRDATATAESLHDGWFRTGDIAIRDADGYFSIHDRKKNMIVSGGENIYPAEIERVLLDHPSVAEAAVIGVADARWQEVPVAYVVGRGAISIEELRTHLRGQLARFKMPREIVLVDELPRNALGKVQHFRLRELHQR